MSYQEAGGGSGHSTTLQELGREDQFCGWVYSTSRSPRGRVQGCELRASVMQPPQSLPALNPKTAALLDPVTTDFTKEAKVSS